MAHSYCVRQGTETEADYIPTLRMQHADRYGGYGVGYCGGSARCGEWGAVQIKGVGLTPLWGASPEASPDSFHNSGTVNTKEAGREAIWSRICDIALPFGAVPTQAVVLTGTNCNGTAIASGSHIYSRRALLMRTPAVRPAHFMRNLHFQTPLVPDTGLCADAVRAREMIQSLPSVFEQAFGSEVSGTSATARVNMGMMVMTRRFAAQVAAAFAKRIFHGSLGCSNIALDGRYMDFGTTTCVNAYRQQAGSPLWPDQWRQHTTLVRTLTYLLFHVGKYLNCHRIKDLVSVSELKAEFDAALCHRSTIEFLKLTGIPEQTITNYDVAKRRRAYRCMRDIYTRGASSSFVWRGDDDPTMAGVQPLQRLGRYDLNEILILSAKCHDLPQLQASLYGLFDDTALTQEFLTVYADLITWFQSTQPGMDATVAGIFLARQATRLNANVSHLTREILDEHLSFFDDTPSDMGSYIDSTIGRAREIFGDEPPALVDFHGERITGFERQLSALKHMSPRDAQDLLNNTPLQCLTIATIPKPKLLCGAL